MPSPPRLVYCCGSRATFYRSSLVSNYYTAAELPPLAPTVAVAVLFGYARPCGASSYPLTPPGAVPAAVAASTPVPSAAAPAPVVAAALAVPLMTIYCFFYPLDNSVTGPGMWGLLCAELCWRLLALLVVCILLAAWAAGVPLACESSLILFLESFSALKIVISSSPRCWGGKMAPICWLSSGPAKRWEKVCFEEII